MPSPESALVVIACPHCGTRYQLAYAAIGTKGRNVACAHCGQSWEAHAERPVPVKPPKPERQKALGELAEEALDEKFIEEERRQKMRREASARASEEARAAKLKARADDMAVATARAAAKAEGNAPPTPAAAEVVPLRSPEHQRTLDEIRAAVMPRPPAEPLDAAAQQRQQHEFSRRQRSLYDTLPVARSRRLARFAALGALVVVVGGGLGFRGAAVQQFPPLAGLYAGIGLPVNVIGLEFRDVTTLKALQQGAEVLSVKGQIHSVAGHEVVLPKVIVTLLDPAGAALYEWSVAPKAGELEPGETLAFETQLTAPPAAATGVKLTFANGRQQSKPADSKTGNVAPGGAVASATVIGSGDGNGKH